jgi:hypothetical protein
LQLGQYDSALDAFQHAIELKYRPLLNQVNLARTYAKSGNAPKAIEMLSTIAQSENAGRVRPVILFAREFDPIKSTFEFQRVLGEMAPCRKPEYRQFDFWIGNWEVENPSGTPVGHNDVTLEQDGCLLVEHWKSNRGGQTGTSFNYYDIRDQKWHQLYLDNSGNAGAFPAMAGGLVDGKMVMTTDPSSSPVFRWTWYVTGPQRVRQMAERSTDGGKTWQIVWDSTYVKTEPKPAATSSPGADPGKPDQHFHQR